MSDIVSQTTGVNDAVLAERLGRTSQRERKIVTHTFPHHPPREIDVSLGPLPMSWNEQVLVAVVQLLAPMIAVEVGILFGQTTAALATVLPPGGKIYGLDVQVDRVRDYINLWPELWEKIELREGNSHSTLGTLPDGIDFAYIDGEHTNSHILREIQILWPKLSPNAIVAFHDANATMDAIATLPNRLRFPAGPGLVLVQNRI